MAHHLTGRLIQAAQAGFKDAVERLMDEGASVNDSIRGGRTALHEAASFGRADVAELLVTRGADANIRDDDGASPLHLASLNMSGSSAETVTILIAAGACLEARDQGGQTPLHWMATFDKLDGVRQLLDSGADPCAVDKSGQTPAELPLAKEIKDLLEIHMEGALLGKCSDEARHVACNPGARRRI